MSSRRRLASSSYEGACKDTLEQQPLAVFEQATHSSDIARKVAKSQKCLEAFYVMDMSSVECRIRQWRQLFPLVSPFYSLKCNQDPILLALLTQNHRVNLAASNIFELEKALEIVAPSRIQFYSPLLTRKTLRMICALPRPLHSLVVDTEENLLSASALSPSLPLLLRISMDAGSEKVERSLGMPIQQAYNVLLRAFQVGVNMAGISVEMVDSEDEDWTRECIHSINHLLSYLHHFNCHFSIIHIGGGFRAEKGRRMMTSRLAQMMYSSFSSPYWAGVEVVASPGRFFAASAFSLCTNIRGKKEIDASIISHQHVHQGLPGYVYQTNEGVYGALGDLFLHKSPSPFCSALFPSSPSLHVSAILGETLDPVDVPVHETRLPSLSIGDWLLWRWVGAYAFSHQEQPPVYYYTRRKHWQRLLRRKRRHSAERQSDASSEEDNEDLAECFERVFDDY